MKVLVTGHTGFIGGNMYSYLQKKNDLEPIGYSSSKGQNIFNVEQLNKFIKNSDLIFHFAAYAKPGESIKKPIEAIETNVKGVLNVLESCRKYDLPVVYSSSCEIYGGDSKGPIAEEHEMKPTNPYAISKVAADRICFGYYRTYGLDVKIARLFNPYGPRQQMNKIIPVFYSQAIKNKPVTVYGKGKDTRDYVFIDDIIRGLWMSRKLPAGEAINLATGHETSNLDMAKLIIKLTKSKSEISFLDYPEEFGNIINQVGSNDKAKKLLGWHPKVSLEHGAKETINWLEKIVMVRC